MVAYRLAFRENLLKRCALYAARSHYFIGYKRIVCQYVYAERLHKLGNLAADYAKADKANLAAEVAWEVIGGGLGLICSVIVCTAEIALVAQQYQRHYVLGDGYTVGLPA